MNPKHHPWIEHGYRIFAYEGPVGLRVERLAKLVGKNKSSFYHHFADLEVFTEALLDHHLQQSYALAERERASKNEADLIAAIMDFKVDLLFSRQLRIHRDHPDFERCFVKISEIAVPSILPLWTQIIELDGHAHLAGLVLQLTLENFFLQITDETLNPEWLSNYMAQLRTMVREFKKTGKIEALHGTV